MEPISLLLHCVARLVLGRCDEKVQEHGRSSAFRLTNESTPNTTLAHLNTQKYSRFAVCGPEYDLISIRCWELSDRINFNLLFWFYCFMLRIKFVFDGCVWWLRATVLTHRHTHTAATLTAVLWPDGAHIFGCCSLGPGIEMLLTRCEWEWILM